MRNNAYGNEDCVIVIIESLCVGCSLCVPVCEVGALSCYGIISVNDRCNDCLDCVEFCPKNALREPENQSDGNSHADSCSHASLDIKGLKTSRRF